MLHTQAGLTLIEIMVTMAIAVIVLTIAVPNYIAFTRANKLTTEVNNFVQALHLARNEAVRTGGATLCASTDHLSCNTGATSTQWSGGWIIFADYNANGTKDTDEEVIRIGEAFPAGLVITTDDARTTFGRMGFVIANGDTTLPQFTFCNGRTGTGTGRQITANTAGRLTTDIYNGCT